MTLSIQNHQSQPVTLRCAEGASKGDGPYPAANRGRILRGSHLRMTD